MHLEFLLPAVLAVSGARAAPAPVDNGFSERDTSVSAASSSLFFPASTIQTDIIATKGLVNLAFYELTSPPSGNCNLLNAAVRREWSTLSKDERKAYIAAELCLQSKPTKDPKFAAGARSRYDDFVAVHINVSLSCL